MLGQPVAPFAIVGHLARDDGPVPVRVVHLQPMCDLVQRDVVKNPLGGHHQPPREHQPAITAARPPARACVAQGDPCPVNGESLCVNIAPCGQAVTGLGFHPAGKPVAKGLGRAGDVEFAWAMSDPAIPCQRQGKRLAKKRKGSPGLRHNRCGQLLLTRANPVLLIRQEPPDICVPCAVRHGQNCVTGSGSQTQRKATGAR